MRQNCKVKEWSHFQNFEIYFSESKKVFLQHILFQTWESVLRGDILFAESKRAKFDSNT